MLSDAASSTGNTLQDPTLHSPLVHAQSQSRTLPSIEPIAGSWRCGPNGLHQGQGRQLHSQHCAAPEGSA